MTMDDAAADDSGPAALSAQLGRASDLTRRNNDDTWRVGRGSGAAFSFQIQNHFNTITTQKLAIPSTNNQPVV